MRRLSAFCVLPIIFSLAGGCVSAHERSSRRAFEALGPAPLARQAAPPRDADREAPVEAVAEAETPEIADLPALLVEAALRSPALRAAWYDAQAADYAIPVSRRLPEPVVTYGVFLRQVETRVGPQSQRLGVMQGFPWPARLGRAAGAAAARAEAARRRFEALRHQVRREIRRPWAELAVLNATAAELRAIDAVLERVQGSARARVAVGMVGADDLARITLRRAELREREASLADRAAALAALVRSAAGLGPDTKLPEPSLEPVPAALAPMATLRCALEANPEIAAAVAEIEVASAEVSVAGSRRWPEFSLGADWTVVGEARMPGVMDSGKDVVMVSAGIRVPLWSRSYSAEEDAAQARVESARARRDGVLQRAEAELARIVAGHTGATRRVALYESELLPTAHAALNAAMVGYEAGRTSLNSVADLEESVLRYRLALLEARAEQVFAVVDLERLLGTEVN
ncbi:MAG: TolC family protein [Myxococcota bacterium]